VVNVSNVDNATVKVIAPEGWNVSNETAAIRGNASITVKVPENAEGNYTIVLEFLTERGVERRNVTVEVEESRATYTPPSVPSSTSTPTPTLATPTPVPTSTPAPTPTETQTRTIESTMIGDIIQQIVSAIRSIIEAIAKALGLSL